MSSPEMQIRSWVPRYEKKWQDNGDGSFSAEIYQWCGVVEVFTYRGDDRTAAFTSLAMFISPHEYLATLPRHYDPRWLKRLARQFAERCEQLSKSKG